MRVRSLLLLFLSSFIFCGLRAQNIVITEISYNDPSTGVNSDSLEFIEFYNNGLSAVDLMGYQLTTPGSTTAVTFTFPAQNLPAGGYVIVARKSSAIQSFFNISGVLQWTAGSLTNGANSIVIKNNLNVTLDSVRYNTNAPWPTAANGLGSTLMLCDPNLDNNVGSNWVASSPLNATIYSILNGTYVFASPLTGCAVTPPAYNPVFAPVPFTENFDSTWVTGGWFRDVPDNHWKNTPNNANNSWRRNDDGATATWTTPNNGAYATAGANGSIHSARFHSALATNGTNGTLDLYADFSVAGGKRLKFWYLNSSGTDSLTIYWSVDSGATFNLLQKFTTTSTTAWEQKQIDLGSSVSPYVIIRFKASATSNAGTTDIGLDGVDISLIPMNDAGIAAITQPVSPVTNITDTIKATVKNFGGNDLTSAWINWAVNGVSQTPYYWTGNLATLATATGIILGTYTFSPAGLTTIKAWTSLPNNVSDPDHSNDTLSKSVYYQGYANIPFWEHFDSTWVNKLGNHDVPDFWWNNNPLTGNNSMRRDDDGTTAAWTTTTGAYTPAGANGSIHSARFHSAAAANGTTGNLDLYLNFNTAGAKRLNFWYINTSGTDSLALYMSVDSGATFHYLTRYITSAPTAWEQKQLDLGSSLSKKVILRFKASSSFNSGTTDIGFDEVNVFIIPPDNAGISTITNPTATLTQIVDTVKVTVQNFGGNSLTSAWINWSVDGILQTPYYWTGNLAYGATAANVSLGPHTFAGSGFQTIRAWTSLPNNNTDTDPTNDTATKSVYYQNFAPIPFIEHFDSLWINKVANHDVPSLFWSNTPSTGSPSWRRADDGATANWTAAANGAYTPTGANSTSLSARFHTAGNASGIQGTFDVFLDFTTPGIKELRFYQINTNGTDSLAVWMSTDGGTTFSFLAKYTTATAWTQHIITLGPGTSNKVDLRFRATANNAGTSDIGIDEVAVNLIQPDAGVLSIVSPVSGCGLTNNSAVAVKVKNFGLLPISNVPVSYKIDGVTFTGSIAATMQPGDTVLYTFSQTVDLSAPGLHTAKYYTSLAPDNNNLNDTIVQNVTNVGVISTFPFLEDFETGGTNYFFLQGTTNAAATVEVNIGTNVSHGMRLTGGAAGTWPAGSGTSTTAALAWSYTDHQAMAYSCLVNASSLTHPVLVLDLRQYYITGGGPKYSWFRVLINDTVQVPDMNGIADFNPLTATADSFANHVFDLGAYGSGHFKVTLEASCKYAPGGTNGLGDDALVDNIIIKQKPPLDFGITSLSSPVSGCGLGNEFISVMIRNYGTVTPGTFQVKAKVDNGIWVTQTSNLVINPDSTRKFTFTTPSDFSAAGPHTVTVAVALAGDANILNDSIHAQVINTPYISSYPYSQDFESSAYTGWTSGMIATLDEWVLGTPAKVTINTAHSGVNAWVTGLTGNYNNNSNSYVQSPCFNLGSLNNPFVSVYLNFVTQTNTDAMVLEASINDSAWVKVGDSLFYNNYNATAPVAPPKWAGSSNGWKEYFCLMPNIAHKSKVVFRFRFQTNNNTTNQGFAMDDFKIMEGVPDVSMISWNSPLNGCSLTPAEVVTVNVLNGGPVKVDHIPVRYSVNGGTSWITDTIPDTLAHNQSIIFNFAIPANFAAPGLRHCLAVCALPTDAFHGNDTVKMDVASLLEIASLPFLETFETANNYFGPWAGINSKVAVENNVGFLNTKGLHFTGGPAGTWPANSGYNTNIAQAWSYQDHLASEKSCNVQLPAATKLWFTLHLRQTFAEGPQNCWFRVLINDTTQVADSNGFMNFTPATANSDVFVNRVFDLTSFIGTNFSITMQSSGKFSPATSSTGIGDNVFIDNVRLYDPTTVGIQSLNQEISFILYPNPAGEVVYIYFNSIINDGELNLINELGQNLKIIKLNSSGMELIDLSDLPPGVYGIVLSTKGKTSLKKFIKY